MNYLKKNVITFGLIVFIINISCNSSDGPAPASNIDISFQQASDLIDSVLTPQPNVSYLIENVNVVDVRSGVLQPNQFVHVEEGVIKNVQTGGISVDDNVQRIDGSNQFLIPGLADMHVHLISGPNLKRDLLLFIAHGVTTIRVMWGFKSFVDLRDSINGGLVVGPKMLVASAGFNGPSNAWESAVRTQTTQEVREYVQAYKDANFDYIKVYSGLPIDQYDALIDEANQLGIQAIGHVPSRVGVNHVANKQQSSIEHLGVVGSSLNQITFQLLKDQGVRICPTLTVINRNTSEIGKYRSDPLYRSLSPELRQWYDGSLAQPVSGDLTSLLNSQKETLNVMHREGQLIIAGTDTGIRYIYPGSALHEELEHYVDSGLTPAETIRSATLNVGEYLSDKIGIIESGYSADLVLLASNPLNDIGQTRNINGVMIDGKWLSKNTIQRSLNALAVLHE